MSIEGQIASSNPESSINGLDLHKLRIQISSATNAEIIFSGLSIPYSLQLQSKMNHLKAQFLQ